ncbi:MAG: hypothetical protein BAJALOKI2v1_100069 [Promethearchaeota archaeon]|nr:MAG: hypothetical protein BAJALOKI2v1_100069 [Candidatus Lokiarchaeota archaeon]
MSPLYTGFPAIIYSALWILKKLGILEKDIPDAKILILITDAPPAFMIKIKGGEYKIDILENIKNMEDIERVPSEMYIALPSHHFLGSIEAIFDGISKGIIKIKNEKIFPILGKIGSVF